MPTCIFKMDTYIFLDALIVLRYRYVENKSKYNSIELKTRSVFSDMRITGIS